MNEILYCRDVHIQETLEDNLYLQESLLLEDEDTSTALSLPNLKVTGIVGLSAGIQ